MKNFDEYAYYYDMFYRDKDYTSEAMKVSLLINKYWQGIDNAKKILNLGCGTGKHDIELAKLGYQIKGVDLSDNMISTAKKNITNDEVSFEIGDARNYRDGEKYDVCTALFHVMSYQNSNDDLESVFNTSSDELKDGGLFVFDCWYGPGVLSEKPAVRIKQVEDDNNILIRHAIPIMYPNKNIVDVNYDVMIINKQTSLVSKFREVHSMRYLFTPEIELMIRKAGFELIDCVDCNTLEKATFNSWTAYYIARKK